MIERFNDSASRFDTIGRYQFILFASILLLMFFSSQYNYLLFHTLAELFSIFVSFCIFFISWYVRKCIKDGYLLFMGIACFFIGILDLFHTLSYREIHLFKDHFESNLATQAWMAARYLQSISFLAANLFLNHKLKVNKLFILYFIITTIMFAVILKWKVFPICFVEGQGLSAFKIYSEFIISGLLLTAAYWVYRNKNKFETIIFRWIIWSILIALVTELFFIFDIRFYGLSNLLGHFFKIISFFLIFRAIIQDGIIGPNQQLFSDFKSINQQLKEELFIRRQIEERLLFRKKELEAILGAFPDLYIWLEADGTILSFYAGKISACNFLKKKIIGQKITDVLPITVANKFETALERIKQGVEIVNLEYNLVLKNEDTYFEARLLPLIKKQLMVIVRDITARKKAEQTLIQYRDTLEQMVYERTIELERANQKLESQIKLKEHSLKLEKANMRLKEADQLKSVFLASMSHELRTPLNSIIGFTGIMLMGMTGQVNEEQKRQLSMVKESACHLLSLINDILDISKIEAGKVKLYIEQFEFNDVLLRVVEGFLPQADIKNLTLNTKIPEGKIILVSDERRVKQILINLIGNAIKFTDQGGVNIIVHQVENKTLKVSIFDSGIGISNNDLKRLFRPFQQINSSHTRRYEGTGLGLYLTRKLLALLNGKIDVTSKLNKGSEFRLTLPFIYKETHAKDTGN